MAFLETALVAFGVILLAEMGDKSQLVLITLAMRGHSVALFLGAASAFLLLVTLAVAFAGLITRFVPGIVLALLGGLLFIIFGVVTLMRRDDASSDLAATALDPKKGARGAFMSAFTLIFVAEMGDKTQLAVLALAAASGAPIAVGIGAVSAQLVLATVAILLGGWFSRYVPVRWVRVVSGAVFLIVGVLLVVLGAQDANVTGYLP